MTVANLKSREIADSARSTVWIRDIGAIRRSRAYHPVWV